MPAIKGHLRQQIRYHQRPLASVHYNRYVCLSSIWLYHCKMKGRTIQYLVTWNISIPNDSSLQPHSIVMKKSNSQRSALSKLHLNHMFNQFLWLIPDFQFCWWNPLVLVLISCLSSYTAKKLVNSRQIYFTFRLTCLVLLHCVDIADSMPRCKDCTHRRSHLPICNTHVMRRWLIRYPKLHYWQLNSIPLAFIIVIYLRTIRF